MSPYQQDVIDASMAEFDKQSAKGITGIGQQAAMSGNLGGGREGVMRSEYQSEFRYAESTASSTIITIKDFNQAQGQANTATVWSTRTIVLMAGANQQQVFNNQNQLGAELTNKEWLH